MRRPRSAAARLFERLHIRIGAPAPAWHVAGMAQPDPLHVQLQLRRGGGERVGMDRIRLLKAIAEHGSISKACQAVGVSFRAAWNAVQALNNLFDGPLVVTQVGGPTGGSATVTDLGVAVIAGYEKLDRNLNALMAELSESLGGQAGLSPSQVLWSLGMKTSARNALRGVVETVTPGAVNGEVILRISPAVNICAVITLASIEDLDLRPGREAVALIKSSFVILAPGDQALRTSARNQLRGVVISHQAGAVNDEIVLELDGGKTLTATITRGSADDLGFKVGDRAQALIKASHVILAVD